MPVIKNKILPIGKNYFAINLFGLIFAKGKCDSITLNHEKIHTRQMIELLVIPFYLWYVTEWLIRLLFTGKSYKAYSNIAFEREAYTNQGNQEYLKTRKPFSFLSYLSK